MFWLSMLCILFLFVIILLLIKMKWMHIAVEEIRVGFAERLEHDTNTLLTISSRDPYIRKLASDMNTQLCILREKRQQFQNGDLELKEAVANISHDLRTPLTAICGYLDLLKHEQKSIETERYLSIIGNRTEALIQLTEELFRYSVFTTASNDTSYEEVALNEILEDSIATYYVILKERGIIPQINITEKRIKRYLNKNALSRIFENIINNAIKYSDGDLNITLCDNGNITFLNHASKLDTVQVERMFERFYTVETAAHSTGLGLTIAKALTDQMSGEISASYQNGCISIYLRF